MEINVREELIQCWNDNIKDKEPEVFLSNIEEYLKFIEQKILRKELELAISSISEIHKDEFKKEGEFGQILECVKNFTLPSSTKTDYLFIVLELVHNKLITYNDPEKEIKKILEAYKAIFKTKDDEKGNELKKDLIQYFDLEKERGYSVITSNFLDDKAKDNLLKANRDYEIKLLEISKGLAELDKERKKLVEKEEKFFKDHFKDDLFTKSKKSKIGSSIGIDPLTDDLLLRSFESGKEKDVIIILGKDSYPCFHLDENKLYHSFQPPLYNYSMYNHSSFYKLFGTRTKKDKKFEVDPVISKLMDEHIFLFLNLYPDFRPEFEKTTGGFKPDPEFVKIASRSGREGDLTKCFDYCAKKFESVIQIIQNNKFTIKAIISLGVDVKYSLVRNGNIYPNNSDLPITDEKIVKIEKEKIGHFKYKNESKTINIGYIPIYHPSMPTNFTKEYNENYFKILGELLKPNTSSVANV